jgi:FMN phosphatase YigB (HAD superfamily)
VAEPKIQAVVLDLFDTIVKWDPGQLPLIQWQERELRSTVPWFVARLEEALSNQLERNLILGAYFEVLQELNDVRERDAIEVSCQERFVKVLRKLEYDAEHGIAALALELTRLHMAGVRRVAWAPPERVAALREIAPHHRLAILSNFDDSETGYQIIGDTGVAHLFEAIIISADIGLRKPHPDIFRRMMEMLKISDPRTILFVGDTPRFDITGPHRAGMRTVWLSESKEPLTPDIPEPDFTIGNLAELPALLRLLR